MSPISSFDSDYSDEEKIGKDIIKKNFQKAKAHTPTNKLIERYHHFVRFFQLNVRDSKK